MIAECREDVIIVIRWDKYVKLRIEGKCHG